MPLIRQEADHHAFGRRAGEDVAAIAHPQPVADRIAMRRHPAHGTGRALGRDWPGRRVGTKGPKPGSLSARPKPARCFRSSQGQPCSSRARQVQAATKPEGPAEDSVPPDFLWRLIEATGQLFRDCGVPTTSGTLASRLQDAFMNWRLCGFFLVICCGLAAGSPPAASAQTRLSRRCRLHRPRALRGATDFRLAS